MKIIYLTAELPYTTQEAFVIPEILALLQRGFEVKIVPRSPRQAVTHGDAQPLVEHTWRQPVLSLPILLAALAEIGQNPGKSWVALRLASQGRTKSIRVRNLSMYLKGLWLARRARKWGAEHIHAHWATTPATMALVASEVTGIPWSFTAHRWDIVENSLLKEKVERATLARFISRSGVEMAQEAGVPPQAENVRVLHMGLPIPRCPAIITEPREVPLIMSVGNLLPVKGHKYLVEAIALLKKRGIVVNLHIAGEGEQRASLEQQIATLGLESQVRLLGQVSHKELLSLYAAGKVDTVVLPSVDLGNGEHEGIPVSLIEGMAYGIPVVSTLTGGIPELLEGGAGLLVPPQNAAALSDALACLHSDPLRQKEVAQAGRARIEEQYSIEAVSAELAAHFESHRSKA